jgi:hypothetical protein
MVDVHGRVLNPPKIQYGGRVGLNVNIETAAIIYSSRDLLNVTQIIHWVKRNDFDQG